MALKLSIELDNASFGDLVALVDAARSAGMNPEDSIDFDGQTLSLEVDVDAFFPSFTDPEDDGEARHRDSDHEEVVEPEIIDRAAEDRFGPRRRPNREQGNPWDEMRRNWESGANRPFDFVDTSKIGDAAIRSVIDILTGRQEPPRR